MAEFLTELEARLLDDDKIWEILSPLIYQSDLLRFPIEVPKGFQTDFASIPRWIPIVSNVLLDRAHREGVIHDYLYKINSIPVVDRYRADSILYESMVCRGKKTGVCHLIYWGVRIGGMFSYHKRKVEDKL